MKSRTSSSNVSQSLANSTTVRVLRSIKHPGWYALVDILEVKILPVWQAPTRSVIVIPDTTFPETEEGYQERHEYTKQHGKRVTYGTAHADVAEVTVVIQYVIPG